MESYNKKSNSDVIFLLLQAGLYLAFLFLDLTGGSAAASAGIKYTVIILCFCYALLYGNAGKSIFLSRKAACKARRLLLSHSLLLQAGLFFTLISDLFILLLDQYFYGVLTFLVVQQIYGIRLLLIREELERKNLLFLFLKRLLLQLAVSVFLCAGLAGAGVAMEGLLATSVFYFISILTNTVSAIRMACRNHRRYNNLLYAAGMLLFLLCDLNVGLFNLSGFITMPQQVYSVIYAVSGILMWFFYAPSQVLIALSSRNREEGGASLK